MTEPMGRVRVGALVAVVVCLCLVALLVVDRARAGEEKVQLHEPAVEGTAVRLTGVAPPGASVQLMEQSKGRWLLVDQRRPEASGDFLFVRPLPSATTSYRVTTEGGERSQVRTVTPPELAPPVAKAPPAPTRGAMPPRNLPPPSTTGPASGITGDTRAQVAPALATAADACGEQPLKPDGTPWACVLADDFEGDTLDRTIWTPLTQPGDKAGSCFVDDPRTVSVSGGTLRLTVQPVSDDLQCPAHDDATRSAYASASVSSFWYWSAQFGRFETRIKVPPASSPGLQEAFWLWPDIRYAYDWPWPSSGEIDVVETYSLHPDLAIPFLHYTYNDNGGPIPGLNTAWDCGTSRGDWHTYTLEWAPGRVEVLVDGRTCLVNNESGQSFHKRFIASFTQMLGVGTNRYDPAVGPDLPATTEVDYIRVWQ